MRALKVSLRSGLRELVQRSFSLTSGKRKLWRSLTTHFEGLHMVYKKNTSLHCYLMTKLL